MLGDRAIEARVADRHGSLVGEGLHQRELLVGPFPVAGVVEADDAHGPLVAHERDQACRLDTLSSVGRLHLAGGRVAAGAVNDEAAPLSHRANAHRGALQVERANASLEGIADSARSGQLEGTGAVHHQPQTRLVRLE